VKHAGDRPDSAGSYVGGGARDGAGDRNTPEQDRTDIGGPLRHQLTIRAVPSARHAIGDDGREQRFDRAKKCNGCGVREDSLRLGQAEWRKPG